MKRFFCFVLLSSCYLSGINQPLTIYIARERASEASDGRDRWDREATITLSKGWKREEAEQRIDNAIDDAMEGCQFDTQRVYGQMQAKDGPKEGITEAYPDFVTKFNEMLAQHDTNKAEASLAVLIGRLDMQHDSLDKLQERTDLEFRSGWNFQQGQQQVNAALAKAMKGRTYNTQLLFCRFMHGGKRHNTGRGYISEYHKKYPAMRAALKEELAKYDPANQKE